MTPATHRDTTVDVLTGGKKQHCPCWYLMLFCCCVSSCVNTHSDPDESPSTVPALMLMATPFSWSGRLALAGAARLSLEEDPCGDAVPGMSSLWMRSRPFLSTIGDSCFFFRIPAQEEFFFFKYFFGLFTDRTGSRYDRKQNVCVCVCVCGPQAGIWTASTKPLFVFFNYMCH